MRGRKGLQGQNRSASTPGRPQARMGPALLLIGHENNGSLFSVACRLRQAWAASNNNYKRSAPFLRHPPRRTDHCIADQMNIQRNVLTRICLGVSGFAQRL